MRMTRRFFIAGPMTGFEDWNYPAFDDAAARLRAHFGSGVIYNPANNHARKTDLPRHQYIMKTLDQLLYLAALHNSSGLDESLVTVLPGWELSDGAKLEVEASRQLGLPVFPLECVLDPHWGDDCHVDIGKCLRTQGELEDDYEELAKQRVCEEPHESIAEEEACEATAVLKQKLDAKTEPVRAATLAEARHLICGDRNNQYGPPGQDFLRTANILTSLGYGKGDSNEVLDPHDVAVIMIALKLSRLMWSSKKRDSWVDVAGYAGCGAEVADAT